MNLFKKMLGLSDPWKLYQQAKNCIELRNYIKAKNYFKEAAEQGFGLAQYALGSMYHNAEGIPQDYNKAIYWYSKAAKAAEDGDGRAQHALGSMYHNAEGVPQDYNKAIYWYSKSAEQDYVVAQYKLGLMYQTAEGTPQDYNKAIYWYSKSAEQGFGLAQYELGSIYYHVEVIQDYNKAIYWLSKTAEEGYELAQYELGSIYHNAEVIQDYNKAIYWYSKSAEDGDGLAQYELGSMYHNAEGVPQDYNKAFYWFSKAAEDGDGLAQHALGSMYHNAEGVPQDYNKAFYWFSKAAEDGYELAQYELGLMYQTAEGTPQDYNKAIYWYSKAAEEGHAQAKINLLKIENLRASYQYTSTEQKKQYDFAKEFESPIGQIEHYDFTKKDMNPTDQKKQYDLAGAYMDKDNLVMALKWYTKAANQGYGYAYYFLMMLHAYGKEGIQNHFEAIRWGIKASQIFPEISELKFSVGESYFKINDYGLAKQWLEKSINTFYANEKDNKYFNVKDATSLLEKIELISNQNNTQQQSYSNNKQSSEEVKQSTSNNKLLIECPACKKTIRIKKIKYPQKGTITCKCKAKLKVIIDKHDAIHVTPIDTDKTDIVTNRKDALSILKLNENASQQEIKASYKRLIRGYHPDKVSTLGDRLKEIAEEESKLINQAYKFLKE